MRVLKQQGSPCFSFLLYIQIAARKIMNTYETHIMPQKCFVHAQFCNGNVIDTSINPEISNEDIFDHYLGRTFTFAQFDEKDNEIEIKTKCIRLLITRKETRGERQEPAVVSTFEQVAV